uniref:propionyl-CoA carboxylase n=1 Tax=Parascaris equorum TaxID=6256 RepID=A0A914SJT6_PAREQ
MHRSQVIVDGKKVNLRGDLNLARSVLHLTVNGKGVATQIASKKPGEFTLIYKGSPFKMKVMPALANNMLKFMKEKPKLDLSTVVIAPMPGAIKSVTAKVGMMVTEGQELCVMEAMKMQNSLLAGKTGK